MTRLPILTYHAIDAADSALSTSPARFRAQMQELRASGWRTLSIEELLAGHGRGGWSPRTLLLTFDDGFRSFAEEALPVLQSCGFKAVLFPVAGWIGRTNDWPGQPSWVPRQPLADWTELGQTLEAGIEIGAHTISHPRLPRLPESALRHEIVGSKELLEDRLSCRVTAFAYPYGELSATAQAVVEEHFPAGFSARLAFATPQSRRSAFERIDAYYLRTLEPGALLDTLRFDLYLRGRRAVRRIKSSAASLWAR